VGIDPPHRAGEPPLDSASPSITYISQLPSRRDANAISSDAELAEPTGVGVDGAISDNQTAIMPIPKLVDRQIIRSCFA
jgi:hypothetical protein